MKNNHMLGPLGPSYMRTPAKALIERTVCFFLCRDSTILHMLQLNFKITANLCKSETVLNNSNLVQIRLYRFYSDKTQKRKLR